MLFSSISFLYYFLPLVLIFYFIVPFRFKNAVLLLFSLVFYFYGEPIYTFLMLGSTLSAYIHGLLIHKYRDTKLSKVFLLSSVTISLLTLGFFKYADFFISNVNGIFGSSIPLLKIALPIGISFYTFQTMSYTIDVYRGEAAPQKSYVKLAPLDKWPVSPGTPREASGVPCLNPRRGLTLLSQVCRDLAIGV